MQISLTGIENQRIKLKTVSTGRIDLHNRWMDGVEFNAPLDTV